MQMILAFGALMLLVLLVLFRVHMLRAVGVKAFHFGELDKKDFLIFPFVLLYVYMIVAYTFGLPKLGTLWFDSVVTGWIGVFCCVMAIVVFLWGLISFGRSFRIGIDEDKPDQLITSGAFGFSRNPLYLGFISIFTGLFLVFPTWFFFIYWLAGVWLINRQVKREEESLHKIYGDEYAAYCKMVRRYL